MAELLDTTRRRGGGGGDLEEPTSRPNDLEEPLLSSYADEHDDDDGQATTNTSPSPDAALSLSPNIRRCLVYTFFAFAGRSVWSQSVLASFVFLLTSSSPKVGYSTAVLGMTQLVVSIPAGWYTDVTGRRDGTLRAAAWVGLAAALVTLYACCIRDPPSYGCLLVALTAWGAFWGMANTSVMALFADAIPDGQRSHYFTRRSIVTLAGNTCGPLVSLVMFVLLGDTWTLPECALVIALGQVFFLPALVLSMFFNDDDNYNISSRRRDEAGASSQLSLEENLQDEEEPLFLRLDDNGSNETDDDENVGGVVPQSPQEQGW
jgi:Major Facilitator Superfamily